MRVSTCGHTMSNWQVQSTDVCLASISFSSTNTWLLVLLVSEASKQTIAMTGRDLETLRIRLWTESDILSCRCVLRWFLLSGISVLGFELTTYKTSVSFERKCHWSLSAKQLFGWLHPFLMFSVPARAVSYVTAALLSQKWLQWDLHRGFEIREILGKPS